MAHLDLTDDRLTVRLTGVRRIFGRYRPLNVPRQNITAVRPAADIARGYPGMRWGVSTYVPGMLTLGSFRRNGSRDFWDVAEPERAIVVELTGEKYDRLILEVDDPAAAVAAIGEAATGSACGSRGVRSRMSQSGCRPKGSGPNNGVWRG